MADDRFFGHPPALGYLALTEVWERLSYYGMQVLLPLYLVKHLLEPERAAGVYGLAAFRTATEAITGPLTTIAFAAQLFGFYFGLVCIGSIVGGWIGDRITGRSMALILGGSLMALGHLAMAFEPLFMLSLLLLIAGAGLFKGNYLVQVGDLYTRDDPRRTRAFAIAGGAAQMGAIFGPLICGTLGEVYGWHYGFTAAGIGMVVGLVIYISALGKMPQRAVNPEVARSPGVISRRIIAALMLLYLSYVLIITAALQAYSIFMIWAVDGFDRQVGSMTMPVSWFFTFDGIAATSSVLLALILWNWQSKRGQEPSDYTKIGISYILTTSAFLFLSGVTALADGAKLPIVVGFLFFIILTPAFVFWDAPLKAITTRAAPQHLTTTMIGIFIAMFGVASILSGAVGRYFEPLGPAGFWLLTAGIAASAAILFFLTSGWLRRTLEGPAGNNPCTGMAQASGLVPGLKTGLEQ